MKAKVSELFLTLTSKRIFYLFGMCLLIGGAAIFLNIHPIKITVLLVAFYSVILAFAQNKAFLALSTTTKNSPYFLGFLFTLICLLNIFRSLPALQETLAIELSRFLVPQIGTALLTTVVGLIGRQYILSSDPTQEQHEKIFKLATDELKENISAYKIAQQKLLDLIDEFVTSHTMLMEQEKQVSKEHISLLTDSSKALQKLGKQYPPKVQQLLDSFDEIQHKFDEFINNSFKPSFEQFPEIQSQLFKEGAEKIREFQNDYVVYVRHNLDNLLSEAQQLKKDLSDLSMRFRECNTIMDNGFRKNLSEIESHLSSLSSTISTANQTIETGNEGIKGSFQALQQHYEALGTQIGTTSDEYLARLKLFKDELKEVDQLIDTFIEVTKKRLQI